MDLDITVLISGFVGGIIGYFICEVLSKFIKVINLRKQTVPTNCSNRNTDCHSRSAGFPNGDNG